MQHVMYTLTASPLDTAATTSDLIESGVRATELASCGQNLCSGLLGVVLPGLSQYKHPHFPLNCFMLVNDARAGKSTEHCNNITLTVFTPAFRVDTSIPRSRLE